MPQELRPAWVCIVCDHAWMVRKDAQGKVMVPIECPGCRTRKWNGEKKARPEDVYINEEW